MAAAYCHKVRDRFLLRVLLLRYVIKHCTNLPVPFLRHPTRSPLPGKTVGARGLSPAASRASYRCASNRRDDCKHTQARYLGAFAMIEPRWTGNNGTELAGRPTNAQVGTARRAQIAGVNMGRAIALPPFAGANVTPAFCRLGDPRCLVWWV